MGYRPLGGLSSLKKAIASWLSFEKGVMVDEKQIFICSGSYQALMLALKTLEIHRKNLTPRLIIENPSYTPIAEGAFECGFQIIPAETDNTGINPASIEKIDNITAVCVTPSHLFPRGEVYPIKRRLKLCHMTKEKDFYIIENDFEGNFKLRGAPVPPLLSLDTDRVFYTGTFSQLLYPGIRTGFLVVPKSLLKEANCAISITGYDVPVSVQKALSLLITDGTLSRHRLKMRHKYQKRQALFIAELKKTFGSEIHFYGKDTGLYILCEFDGIEFNNKTVDLILKDGIKADYEFRYYWPHNSREQAPGLLLGYGQIDENNLNQEIKLLKQSLDKIKNRTF
ncbi:MAG: PLP-dependent aminotransferase family protein [Spirochaetales bacterium]|nr:PLP-dependent aminotransferase family protein [Spirochaetales bacterium]